jgi:hypothetical protein
MKAAAFVGLALSLAPSSAWACASCISTPFGDQTYTWPYLGLILLPFGLIAAIVGILGYHAGYRPRTLVRRLVAHFAAKDDPQIIKETT